MSSKKLVKNKSGPFPSFTLALVVSGLGLLTFIPFYVWIYSLQSHDKSPAAIAMASMHMSRLNIFWAFPILQASGLAALIWSYIGVLLGLMVSGKNTSWFPFKKAQFNQIHRQISLLVIGLMLIHAIATAFDAMGDNFITVFIPWQTSWKEATLGYNLGIFALYLAILLGPTYYLRERLGTRTWMFAHRFTLFIYILSVWHTLILGLDTSYYSWVRPFIWIIQIPLLLLLIRRLLLKPSRTGKKAPNSSQASTKAIRYGLAVLSGIVIMLIIIIVLTGHSGFIPVV
ncbi:ferric reductase-like transmembrane domain-containing protein [Heyndrickxia acidicola]|uniref:Ferric reductase-like transmembrane domain-containing protein n=1 Tax=Heyndrickxia acidicola TaxID=209389 RepID=A0ABU6MK46_9BACI|nr:ferric reductase-like transmembrane domain-containing protein [Heyndrickxia acidicola]MED1203612.1 ferric reductase-like transmembrane domain-containing protein [Heyndrickxia acidicola]